MTSKKTLILVFILLVLAAAAYFFINKDNKLSTVGGPDSEFFVSDTASVNKIFISNKSGQNFTFTRQGPGKWLINNKFDARQDMINMILETLHKVRMKRPVSKAAHNNVVRTLAAQGVKVEVYQNNQLAKQFYVGGTTADELGTYFIMQGAEDPYVAHIPGFNGFLDTRFNVKLKDWRRVPVFNSIPAGIEEVAVKFPKEPAKDFTIRSKPEGFDVVGMEGESPEAVKQYLSQFVNVNGQVFIDDMHYQFRDSLNLLTPFATISLTDKDSTRSNSIRLYENPHSVDHHLGITSEFNEVMLVQEPIFRALLVDKQAFKNQTK